MSRITRHKAPFIEPRDGSQFQQVIDGYKSKLEEPTGNGAIFFAVCRGKVGLPLMAHCLFCLSHCVKIASWKSRGKVSLWAVPFGCECTMSKSGCGTLGVVRKAGSCRQFRQCALSSGSCKKLTSFLVQLDVFRKSCSGPSRRRSYFPHTTCRYAAELLCRACTLRAHRPLLLCHNTFYQEYVLKKE
eukprot:scaffold226054_cov16-Tisochrysis_lutea.AAC.1